MVQTMAAGFAFAAWREFLAPGFVQTHCRPEFIAVIAQFL
jgi:hypothetical protein